MLVYENLMSERYDIRWDMRPFKKTVELTVYIQTRFPY